MFVPLELDAGIKYGDTYLGMLDVDLLSAEKPKKRDAYHPACIGSAIKCK